MRVLPLAAAGLLLLAMPLASAAEDRTARFAMGKGFEDELTVVSGAMTLDAPAASSSAAFFRVSETRIGGLTKACWSLLDGRQECVSAAPGGDVSVVVPQGGSFAFLWPSAYPIEVEAAHALATFVDLREADGFDQRLRSGPSVIASLVDGSVRIGDIPASPGSGSGSPPSSGSPADPAPASGPAGSAAPAGFTVLEGLAQAEIRDSAGLLVRSVSSRDAPVQFEGSPTFTRAFSAQVAVVPFGVGASAGFRAAEPEAAREGLSAARIRLLEEVLGGINVLGAVAKRAPLQILDRANDILSEVFNGALLRTRLSDDPRSLGDVPFARFDELTVGGGAGEDMTFAGSYTLVVGDLGPSFEGSEVSSGSLPLRLWVAALVLMCAVVIGAWLWVRKGPAPRAERGTPLYAARAASAVAAVVTFFVWDWQLHRVFGSSLLQTDTSGASLGAVAAIEASSLLLAALAIGLPAFLIVRYTLHLAGASRWAPFAGTAAVAATLGIGILLMPAILGVLVGLVVA